MDYDRGGRRGRSPNRRFGGRGYRRGNNLRGNYYHNRRQNWHNNYNTHYGYPHPPKPPSPLPGTEEYRQRNIQQTSELIKKQLNLDGSDNLNPCDNLNPQIDIKTIEDDVQKKDESQSNVSEQKKPKSKRNQVEDEEIDVQEIYDKIIKHISSLSYSKKLNLINQSNSGYDIAIQQIQKQKQLELSKALRDMSQRPTQDTDEEVIQSIIPDIGIKLEDLPNSVIEELSKTLQVNFKDETVNLELTENQVVDMNISPSSNVEDNENLEENFQENLQENIEENLEENIKEKKVKEDIIDNIFDFEYLNKSESYDDSIEISKSEVRKQEEGFSFANIDVTKSYLDLKDDIPKRSDCGFIRVKKDIFESSEKEKFVNKLSGEGIVFGGKLFSEKQNQNINLDNKNKNNLINTKEFESNDNKDVIFPEQNLNSNILTNNSSLNKILEPTSSNELKLNTNLISNISNQSLKDDQNFSHPINKEIENKTNSSLFEKNDQNFSHPINKEIENKTNSSPFERQPSQTHISPLLRDVQTPPNLTPDLLTSVPKKWKSPGEKKMLPIESESLPLNEPIKQTNQINQQEIENKKTHHPEDKNSDDKNQKVKKKKKEKDKDKNFKPELNEKDTKSSKIESQNNIKSKEIGTMVNFDSKHKRKRKINVETQTDLILNEPIKQNVNEISTMTDTIQLITVSAQTPMKFFKKNSLYQTKSIQTVPGNCKSIEVQATEKMKNISIQTEKEDDKKKNTELLSRLKLLQQIDEEMKELLAKKASLYESLELLNKDINSKGCSNSSSKKKKNKKNKSDKNCDKSVEVIKTDLNKTNENVSKSNESNEIDVNVSIQEQERELQDVIMKSKPLKSQNKDIKEHNRHSPIQKDKLIKPSQNLDHKEKEISTKPLKLSLKIEKDENNVKKYSLKRDRSCSKDKESTSSSKEEIIDSQADKRLKISKDIESLVYNDNKFLKKCCVKIKPLKSSEYVPEMKENEYEKTFENLEECSRSPRDLQMERDLNICEAVASPHSTCSTSSNSSVRQKSKVIEKLEFKGLAGSIFSLKVIDDNLLAAGDNGSLYIFNVISQELITSINLSTQALTCLHVIKTANNEECLIYAGGLDGNLRIINFNSKEIQKNVELEHSIQCMDISWGYVFLGSTTGELKIYNIKTEKVEDSIHIFDNRIYAIKTMQEGPRRVLLIGTKDMELSIRDAMTGLLMRKVKTEFSPTIYSILADHNLVYCGTNQHDVLAYSFQDGELVKRYEGIASRRVICMQIVDNLLFVGCFNGSVCVFHKSTHQYLGHMIRPGESLLSMVIVNNKVIVGLKNNKLVSWDVPEVYLEKNR